MHPADVFRLRKKTFQITSAMYNAKDEYFVVVKAIEDQMFEKSRDRCSSYVPECPSPKCASRTAPGRLSMRKTAEPTAFSHRRLNRRPD
jgi:hypothetical protein